MAEALREKNLEIEQQEEALTELKQILEQKEAVIKMLQKKDDEQANIITLLQNNLEIRARADVDVSFNNQFLKLIYRYI